MVHPRHASTDRLTATEVRDEDVDVTFLVWLASRATAELLDAALAPSGLDGDEFAIYSMLTAASTITPTELARWTAAPPTTVSSYVKRFEARGHVRRAPNPSDRRSYCIQLTPAGLRAHRVAAEHFDPVRRRVEAALGPQTTEVREALLALRAAVDDARQSPDQIGA